MLRKTSCSAALAALLVLGLSACERAETEAVGRGPAERAGEQLDRAAARAGEELNRLAGAAGETMQQAGRRLQEEASEARSQQEVGEARERPEGRAEAVEPRRE